MNLLRPFVSVNSNFLFICCFRYFKNYQNIEFFTHMLQPLCAWLACRSGTDAHPDHTYQFFTRMLSINVYTEHTRQRGPEHMSQELVHALSICNRCSCLHNVQSLQNMLNIQVSNWRVTWAYGSGIDACPKHMDQELMNTLSIQVRNWCIPWSYTSVSYTYADHITIPNLKRSIQHMLSMHVRNWTVHVHQELMCVLSMPVRNWCTPSACTSEFKWSRAP